MLLPLSEREVREKRKEKSARLFSRVSLFHFGEKEFPFCGGSLFLKRNGAREGLLSLSPQPLEKNIMP
jgi:hypothetical protein